MKRKLRVGEGYALFRNRLKYLNIKHISLLAVLTAMCLYAQAQAPASGVAAPAVLGGDDVTLLQVGDTIPQRLWQLPLPYWNGPDTRSCITLGDFEGKSLILLDFWASYCTTCLNGFPLLDSLQRVHEQDMQVVLVNPELTKDTPGRIVQAFSRRLRIPLGLPVVFPDRFIYRYFEITGIPRYIWIDRNRVIRAITKKAEVTTKSIETFINNSHL